MQGTVSILAQLYESFGDAEAYGIYFHLASVDGVSSKKFSVPLLLNMFVQKKRADSQQLPFMLKNTLGHLDHLNSIRESGASWCTAAETAISNLETEHGITIKDIGDQQYGNHLFCRFNSFEYKWLFPILIH